jgi:Anti-sigma factor NepR
MVDKDRHPREGDESLSGVSKIGSRGPGGRDKPRKRHKSGDATDVGRALRTVYDTTLREEVPKDFLDLLGKLD